MVRPLLVKVVEAPLVMNEYQALESAATVRRGSAMVNALVGTILVVTPLVNFVAS